MPAELPFERRADLDWLRVAAILLHHLFHCGMFFNTWGWHVKNPEPLTALEPVMSVLHLVRIPLLMLIAGAGTAFGLLVLGSFALTWLGCEVIRHTQWLPSPLRHETYP